MFQIDANLGDAQSGPKYEQLKHLLIGQLRSGRLVVGDYLPPEADLAQMLGIARNTVRRALSELESQHLVRRVRGRGTMICGDLDSRKQARSNLYALVLPHVAVGMYTALQGGFGSKVTSQSGQMIVCNTEQDVGKQSDAILRLADQGVAGIVVVPVSQALTPPHHFRFLNSLQVPLVFCHRRVPEVRSPMVAFSGTEVGRLAGQHLVEAGHRRVAYFATHRSEMSMCYEESLRKSVEAVGGELLPEHVHYGQWSQGRKASPQQVDDVRAALEKLFASKHRPTAIMASYDTEAVLVHFLLSQMGVRVPDDLSLIGFGGTDRQDAVAAMKLTSVVVDEERLGEIAGSILGEMITGERELDDNSEIFVRLAISKGETVAPPSA